MGRVTGFYKKDGKTRPITAKKPRSHSYQKTTVHLSVPKQKTTLTQVRLVHNYRTKKARQVAGSYPQSSNTRKQLVNTQRKLDEVVLHRFGELDLLGNWWVNY